MTFSKWGAGLAVVVLSAGIVAACGTSSPSNDGPGSSDGGCPGTGCVDGTVGGDDGPPTFIPSPDGAPGSDAAVDLRIQPADATLQVTAGQPIPTQQYTAYVAGKAVGVAWSVDRGEVGAIGVTSGMFTPAGQLGGKAKVTATYRGQTVSTSVTVHLSVVQAGDPSPPDAGTGAGGYGGVGGSGEGAGATDAQTAVLNGTPAADSALTFLYPYDQTVWPRGILAPLLQWEAGAHSFDALYIHVSEANYEYKGYFQKPTGAASFVNHPLPQWVWKQIANSNGGEDVKVSLVFSEGSNAFGPISESWKIANASLKGTVYYNAYGTRLTSNTCCVFGSTTQKFGGATLAIRAGSTDPVLVAGQSNGDSSGCRVCHSVSANGSTLLTQHGDAYGTSSTYALTNSNAETTLTTHTDGRFQYPAIYPDGTFFLTGSRSGATPSALYSLGGSASGQPVAAQGLDAIQAYLPAFSPDGAHVAYDDAAADKLTAIDFANGTKTFSNARPVYTPPAGLHAYWPSFLPTNDSVVFELETRANLRDVAGTRSDCEDPSGTNTCHDEGAHGELWWADTNGHPAARLDKANGKGYVPPHPTYTGSNGDDSTLNYEPTVNPVPSGGYAWVVFTSRRRYGNVATINPFHSDPRYRDISTVANATPKKLWVAAIDLNAPPGTDPSHPAFYLPGQELLAGNSRGFWVVDPCHADGASCETGDECCGGFCRPAGDGGGLVCTAEQPSCAQEFEKCTSTADCCGAAYGIQCISQRCAQKGPQ